MNEMILLENIERRIQHHIQGAYANIVEVGRCLIEAKEIGVVPHGQFEEWAERVTGLQKRSYQRLMQVAREVSPDSAMAKLPISKITAILALPEAQREAVAEKAVEDNQTLRELQATIDAMKGELDETRRQANRVAVERDNAIAVLDRAQKRRAEFEHECNELRRQVQGIKQTSTISAEAQRQIDNFRGQARQYGRMVDELKAENGKLSAQLADAEKMAEYQARQREEAQQQLLDLRTQAARGEDPAQEDLTAEAVSMAARTFIGCVGYVPHSDKLLTLREGDRQEIVAWAETLQRWSADVLRVIDSARQAVVIEGV